MSNPLLDVIQVDGYLDASHVIETAEKAYPGSVTQRIWPEPRAPRCWTDDPEEDDDERHASGCVCADCSSATLDVEND